MFLLCFCDHVCLLFLLAPTAAIVVWQSPRCTPSYRESSCHLGGAIAVLDKRKKRFPSFSVYNTPWAGFSDSNMDRVCCNMDMLGMSPFTAAGCLPCWWSVKRVWNYLSVSGIPREDREWWELGCGLGCHSVAMAIWCGTGGTSKGVTAEVLMAYLLPKALCQPAPVRGC